MNLTSPLNHSSNVARLGYSTGGDNPPGIYVEFHNGGIYLYQHSNLITQHLYNSIYTSESVGRAVQTLKHPSITCYRLISQHADNIWSDIKTKKQYRQENDKLIELDPMNDE